MIDLDGEQWERVDDAARIVYVRPGTIRVWACGQRGKPPLIRSLRVAGHRYVNMTDTRVAELVWRRRIKVITSRAQRQVSLEPAGSSVTLPGHP